MNGQDLFMLVWEHSLAQRHEDYNVYRKDGQIKISPIDSDMLWITIVDDITNLCRVLRLNCAISNNVITIDL